MSQIVALRQTALKNTLRGQQALCNAIGTSGLHWVWAIAAASGPRLLFVDDAAFRARPRGHAAGSRPSSTATLVSASAFIMETNSGLKLAGGTWVITGS
jgi:hypothetical protein